MCPVVRKDKRPQARRQLAAGLRRAGQIQHKSKPISQRWTLVICILLAVVTVSVYSPVIRHPFINYDDRDYVMANQHVRAGLTWDTVIWALTSTEQANWHPVTWISHALDCQFYGMEAGGHHLSSVLIHALNVVLLFLLLLQATGMRIRSAVVGALFAVHPLNVESVAWIAERKNVLSMFFFLLALGAYGWYARKPNWKRYGAVGVLFALGLAAKPMVITFPCVLLLLDYWPLSRVQGWAKPSTTFAVPQMNWTRLVVEKVPLFLLSAASAIITMIAQRSGHSFSHLPFQLRAENAIYAYGKYLVKVFWPVHLAVLYPHPLNTLTFLQVALSGLFLVSITTFMWRERIRYPYLVIGWFWFLGTLVPAIGLVQVGAQAMADRYAYLPTIGLFVMLIWRTADWAEDHSVSLRTLAPITAAVLLVLCVLTFRQIGYWRSSYDLWGHALQVTQGNYIADDNIGDLLLDEGRPEALRYYQAAADISPFDPISHGAVASNLQDHGDFQNAIREWDIVLRAKPDPVLQANAYTSLGIIYRQLGDYAKAREDSELALRLEPSFVQERIERISNIVTAHPAPEGYFQLGLLLEGANQIAEARSAYEHALLLNPRFDPARKALEASRNAN